MNISVNVYIILKINCTNEQLTGDEITCDMTQTRKPYIFIEIQIITWLIKKNTFHNVRYPNCNII